MSGGMAGGVLRAPTKPLLLLSKAPVHLHLSFRLVHASSGCPSIPVLWCAKTRSRWRLFSTAIDQANTKRQKASKQRLDDYCLQRHPQYSKNVIQTWISDGKVLVNQKVVTKPGHAVPPGAAVEIDAEEPKYVCRAGFKLEAALDAFKVDVKGLIALDAGQSTGGFTDCLLQRGVQKVFGIDVGHGQVAPKVAEDPRVVVMENFNLRDLKPEDLPCKVDLATLDVSFISIMKVLPAVLSVMAPDGQLVVLIKPQFEAGKGKVNAAGLVKDAKVRQAVLESVLQGMKELGLHCKGSIESPLRGDRAGNVEYLAHLTMQQDV